MKSTVFVILFSLICSYGFAQNTKRSSLFLHAEYQLLKYDYLTVGLGYQPRKTKLVAERSHPKYSFVGWTLNYSKKLGNSDWGVSVQNIMYTASTSGPFGMGVEGNFKSVNNKNHFGIKPLIGLSFPVISVMYAYNFDFYEVKSERISQHELIVGIRVPVLQRKRKRAR